MLFLRQQGVYILVALVVGLVGLVLILASGGSNTMIGIGGSLLAAAIVQVLDLVKVFINNGADARAEAFRKAGMTAVHKHRSTPDYRALMKKASVVDVAGYSLRSFLDQHQRTLLERARAGQLKARLLLVDPSSIASQNQETGEHAAAGSFAASVDRVRRAVRGVPSIEVRLLASALPTMTFRIDNTMFVGPQLPMPSEAVPTYELAQGWLLTDYADAFEVLWKAAKPATDLPPAITSGSPDGGSGQLDSGHLGDDDAHTPAVATEANQTATDPDARRS